MRAERRGLRLAPAAALKARFGRGGCRRGRGCGDGKLRRPGGIWLRLRLVRLPLWRVVRRARRRRGTGIVGGRGRLRVGRGNKTKRIAHVKKGHRQRTTRPTPGTAAARAHVEYHRALPPPGTGGLGLLAAGLLILSPEARTYRARNVMMPRTGSYGETPTVTRSPGTTLIRNRRIRPLNWARTSCPASHCTRYSPPECTATTVPCMSIRSSLLNSSSFAQF